MLCPEQPECPPEGEDASGIVRELCTLPTLQACSDFPVQGLSPNGLENAGVPAKSTGVCDLVRFLVELRFILLPMALTEMNHCHSKCFLGPPLPEPGYLEMHEF